MRGKFSVLYPFASLSKKLCGLESDSFPDLQSKSKNGIFNLNTGLIHPNSCGGLVSIFPGGGDNEGKLPPPPLDS